MSIRSGRKRFRHELASSRRKKLRASTISSRRSAGNGSLISVRSRRIAERATVQNVPIATATNIPSIVQNGPGHPDPQSRTGDPLRISSPRFGSYRTRALASDLAGDHHPTKIQLIHEVSALLIIRARSALRYGLASSSTPESRRP
jgi:hypothetical protein